MTALVKTSQKAEKTANPKNGEILLVFFSSLSLNLIVRASNLL